MILSENLLKSLNYFVWYENEKGDRFYPNKNLEIQNTPSEYKYQHSRFPNEVRTCIYDNKKIIYTDNICFGNSDLILAITRPTFLEKFRSFIRTGMFPTKLSYHQAVLLNVIPCERCSNVIAWEYGLPYGYAMYSKSWKQCNNNMSCELCKPSSVIYDE